MYKKGGILIAIIIMGILATISPTLSHPQSEITPNPINTELSSALAAVRIENAFVDVTDKRVLITYNAPKHMSTAAAQHYIISKAANAAPNSRRIVLQVYGDSIPFEEVVVDTGDYFAVMNKKITYRDFEKRIERGA